jgi:hypothetical protein
MRAIAVVVMLLVSSSAFGQKRPPPEKPPEKTINIDPLTLGGKVRGLSMLYFLERANEELERSSLEKRSFVPRLVKTVDDEQL